jgi:ferric-dicitrate binding protein FerR (iron transport regulator)
MFDGARLERLISAHFDGELTADERAELETMLLASSKARQIFLDHADFHGLLRQQAMQENGVDWLEKTTPPQGKVVRFQKQAWIAAGVAACVACGWWLLPRTGTPSPTVVSKPSRATEEVALLGMAVDVQWAGRPFTPGEALPKGLLNIRKGTLRLDFYSGARVILEGPARLELLSPDLARLDEGKLTAKVPPPAQGFTILNRDLRVVDRGTQFGMSVTGTNDCAVHVFDGEVELQGDVPEATATNLFEGDAVAISNGKSTSIAADRSAFADPAGMLEAAARESEAQWNTWQTKSHSLCNEPGLLAYFDFEEWDTTSMTVPNRAAGADENTNGSFIGCEKLIGRWNQTTAPGFAKTSDRMRFRMEGTSDSITMMAWVRVDSLPLDHNALISMSPGEVGEVHWKLDQSGRMLLGLRSVPELDWGSWERLESPEVVTPNDFGRWMHLATVIDGATREMRHYVNGQEVAKGPLKRPVPVRLGLTNLGNCDWITSDYKPVRNFNGRIDEFLMFGRALTAAEISAMQ